MSVKVNLKPLERFTQAVSQGLRSTTQSPVRDALRQWAARYRSFAQQRYTAFSRGGGDWAPLKASTIAARRKGSGVGQIAVILVDTGIMRSALDVQFVRKPGQLQEDIPFGVRVGFGGPQKHPGGTATIADIANFHQTGTQRLPSRKIIVEPDKKTVDAMAGDMVRALRRLA